MIKLPKYKFKVRIIKSQWSNNYIIQYAYYRFIKIWHCIGVFNDYGCNSMFNGIVPQLHNYQYAIERAKTFKTIEDIREQQFNEVDKQMKFYKECKEKEKNTIYKQNIL